MQDGQQPGPKRHALPLGQAAALVLVLAAVPVLDLVGLPRGMTITWGLCCLLGVVSWSRVTSGKATDPVGPIIGGMGIAAVCMSPALIVGVYTATFTNGHDGLLAITGLGGGLFLALLVASVLGQSGARSIPEYMERRFGGRWPGLLSAGILMLSGVLFAAADLTALAQIGSRFGGVPFALAAAVCALVAAVGVASGDSRSRVSLTALLWLLVVCAVFLPLVFVSFARTGIPLGHFALGQAVPDNTALEQALLRRGLAEARSLKPLLTPFVSLDIPNALGIVLALTLGVAVLPGIAGNAGIPDGRSEARRSYLWALLLFGLAMAAIPALAVVSRLEILTLIGKGLKLDALPAWMHTLGQIGSLKICGVAAIDAETVTAACRKIARHPSILRLQDIAADADALLMAVPSVAGLSFVCVVTLAAGLAAAGLASLGLVLSACSDLLRKDLGLQSRFFNAASGLPPALLALTVAAALALVLALAQPTDPLTLVVWSATLAGASVLPALALGAIWKRTNSLGACSAMLAGLVICASYIVGTRYFATSFHDAFGGYADVAPAAQRRFADLQQSWARLAPGPAKDAAWIAYDAHAQRIAGLWGLRSTAVVLLAIPVAAVVMLVLAVLPVGRSRRAAD